MTADNAPATPARADAGDGGRDADLDALVAGFNLRPDATDEFTDQDHYIASKVNRLLILCREARDERDSAQQLANEWQAQQHDRDKLSALERENAALREKVDSSELNGEAIMIMRGHLAGVGIESAFADDATALAVQEITRLRVVAEAARAWVANQVEWDRSGPQQRAEITPAQVKAWVALKAALAGLSE